MASPERGRRPRRRTGFGGDAIIRDSAAALKRINPESIANDNLPLRKPLNQPWAGFGGENYFA